MTWRASLRTRLALMFAAAVALAIVVFGGTVALALYEDGEAEEDAGRTAHAAGSPAQDSIDDIRRVVTAMALVAPLTILGAAGLGFVLAGRALAPMKEASDRAREASGHHAPLDLQLPLTGHGDEWDELASTLNGLLAASRSSMERIRHFTADAAHELRTPLTTLVGEAELALRRERSEVELRRTVEIVLSEGQRLAGLVDRLLLLARSDSGALARSESTVDLGQLVREAIERLPQPEGIAPVIQLSQVQPATVHGDAQLLAQLVTNLLDNAVRYGGVPVQVTLSRTAERARIEVTDAGPGIAPQLEAVLFERFTRGDAARSGTGHGLGLSISRTLAELHGGTLTHARREGPGATFVLELPLG